MKNGSTKQFLNAGVAVAGIDVGEAYGSPEGQKHFSALYKELTENRGFCKTRMPSGQEPRRAVVE